MLWLGQHHAVPREDIFRRKKLAVESLIPNLGLKEVIAMGIWNPGLLQLNLLADGKAGFWQLTHHDHLSRLLSTHY